MFTTLIFIILLFFIINGDLLLSKLIKFFYYTFLFSLVITFFINPGIPGRQYYYRNYEVKEDKTYFFCRKCNLMVPEELNIAHCNKCNVCVLSFDHHCDWIGKCVGKGNNFFFVCFFISFFLFIFSCLFSLFIIFTKINFNFIK